MKQGQFERLYGDTWRQFESLLAVLDKKKSYSRLENAEQFAPLYRKVCHFHALAKERNYSSYLVDRLGELIVRGHQHLYQPRYHTINRFVHFFVMRFPRLLREQQKYFWVAAAMLYLPAFVFACASIIIPEIVYTMVAPGEVQNFEEMYNPANHTLGSARNAETNWYMFGYYINNNISVSFRTFASGLLGGIGSLFFLVFNGLLFGAIAGHLINVGYDETFFTFVIAHGSFELTAIIISGAAGLKLGVSLLCPGNLTRIESLKNAAHIAIQLIYGVIAMLVVAAFIEAFWSSNNLFAAWQKYLVGGVLWLAVACYLIFSGRSFGAR